MSSSSLFKNVKWAKDWDGARVRDWLGPNWKPKGSRRYPSRVVGFKSTSTYISLDELNSRLYYGGLIRRTSNIASPQACTFYAVHVAVNPVNAFAASSYANDRKHMYLVLMDAAGSHAGTQPRIHKWYGETYRVVARMERTWILAHKAYRYEPRPADTRIQALKELGVIDAAEVK